MEIFFWICGALIIIGLPTFAILMIYASLKSVKEYVETIQSLKNRVYNLESDYNKLGIERDNVEIKLEHAIQEKGYIEEDLEKLNSNEGYKHTRVVNAIHYGILKKLYTHDELSYISMLLKNHNGTIADFNREDENEIIETFIKKHPNSSK